MAYLVEMVGGSMEMITLLRANIRHKKGSFISVILLLLLIAMSITTVFSIQQSAETGVNTSHANVDTPDLLVEYYEYQLTDEMITNVRNHNLVKDVQVFDYLVAIKSSMGGQEYSNMQLIVKNDGSEQLLEEDLHKVKGTAPALKKGEIYVPQGYLTSVNGKVGETIQLQTIAEEYTFTIKGILLEPMLGSASIGWKKLCISDEDYEQLQAAIAAKEREDLHGIGKALEIYKADSCTLSDAKFGRQLNLDTGVSDLGYGSITKDMSIQYTNLFPEIMCSILKVFILFLLVIVLIITVHSISVEVETNYVMFGVLKALGFGRGKIRLLFFMQYFLAELLGAVLGTLLAIPLVVKGSSIFVSVIAVPAVLSVPVGTIALVLLALFCLSALSIWISTRKVNRISPVRAIAGGRKEIWFDSRLKLPITQRLLSLTLALRQFTSAKRRYAGSLAIVAILTFFMITISMLGNTMNSKSAAESMGMIVTEVNIKPKKNLTDVEFAQIEAQVDHISKIKQKYYHNQKYFTFDGEQVLGIVYKDPQVIVPLKGRAPLYENEMVITEILEDEFDLNIGDEITISYQGKKADYLITGITQFLNDAGRTFAISSAGADRLDFDSWLYGGYSLEHEAKSEEVAAMLNEKFGDLLEASAVESMLDETYNIAIQGIQLIIYVFAVLFSLIVVHMVCSKAFVQERRDIGIYKAVGFTARRLRLQFAVRFFAAAVLGAGIGAVFSYVCSAEILSLLLKNIGITSFVTAFSPLNFVLPLVLICVSFFVFAYLSSRRIQKVEIRELVY